MYCLKCKYGLAGLSSHRCPECGTPFDPLDRSTYRTSDPRKRPGLLALTIVGASLLFLVTCSVTPSVAYLAIAFVNGALQGRPIPITLLLRSPAHLSIILSWAVALAGAVVLAVFAVRLAQAILMRHGKDAG